MMIPILTDYYEAGYVTRPKYKTLTAFFPNCNLAVRRAVFDEIGLYDEHCRICGEDADICHRTAAGGWELFYEREAVCHHEVRNGMATLVKQWFWYGYEGGYFFQKWQEYRCEIFVSLDARPRVNHYGRLCKAERAPFRILLFLSFFTLFHLWLLMLFLCLLAGWSAVALLLGGVLAVTTVTVIRKSPLRNLRWGQLWVYILVTYVINATCIGSSLLGGLKRNMLYMHSGV